MAAYYSVILVSSTLICFLGSVYKVLGFYYPSSPVTIVLHIPHIRTCFLRSQTTNFRGQVEMQESMWIKYTTSGTAQPWGFRGQRWCSVTVSEPAVCGGQCLSQRGRLLEESWEGGLRARGALTGATAPHLSAGPAHSTFCKNPWSQAAFGIKCLSDVRRVI